MHHNYRSQVGTDSRVNILGTSDDSNAFKDNQLENDNLLGVPFTILYAVELH